MGVSEICARKLTANKSIDLIFLAVATILFKPYLCRIVFHSSTVPRSTTLVMINGISLSQSKEFGSTSQNNLFDKFSSIRYYFNPFNHFNHFNRFNDFIIFNPLNSFNLFNDSIIFNPFNHLNPFNDLKSPPLS